jgi:hypothetical protein
MMTASIAVFVSEIYSPLHQKIAFSIILKKAIAILQYRKGLQVYSNKTPKMKVKEVLKRLQADGWYEVRMRGSHRVLAHPHK